LSAAKQKVSTVFQKQSTICAMKECDQSMPTDFLCPAIGWEKNYKCFWNDKGILLHKWQKKEQQSTKYAVFTK
jgi:hypothetical protein